jgi:DsbC/DsbD-like thiol-disulfide interchange protein
MLSVEQRHPKFAQCCHRLLRGDSAYSGHPEVPYDLHRYRDGWHAYWKNPPDGQIGRLLRTRVQLTAFLRGDWRVGTMLRAPYTKRIL